MHLTEHSRALLPSQSFSEQPGPSSAPFGQSLLPSHTWVMLMQWLIFSHCHSCDSHLQRICFSTALKTSHTNVLIYIFREFCIQIFNNVKLATFYVTYKLLMFALSYCFTELYRVSYLQKPFPKCTHLKPCFPHASALFSSEPSPQSSSPSHSQEWNTHRVLLHW